MFYLWREVYDPKHPRFCVVKFQENIGIQQYEKYESLIDTLQETLQYPYYDHHFLLDDGRFHFFRFNIFRETNTPLTKEDINLIINDRLEYLKTISDETFLFTSIDSIFVNNQPKKFLIGEKGQIFFRLYFVYMNRNTVLSFNKVYGNLFNQENLHIRPESFQTVAFLKKKLERDSFLLLYIKENYCKVILVEDGFYKQIEHINFWISFLMQMYKDNQIVKYWYKTSEEIDQNPLAKTLVLESISFYVEYLCKWLEDLGFTDKDVFLISSILKNGNFMEEFNKRYSRFHNKYIVPFHHSTQLHTFGKHRWPEDMDLLIFLNRSKMKKQILA